MTFTCLWLLAIGLFALSIGTVMLCAAVNRFNLGHVNVKATVWKLASFSFTGHSKKPTTPPAKQTRNEAVAGPFVDGRDDWSPPT